MIEILKFMAKAVARRDFLPALQHFQIRNGTIRAFNGSLALSSPIAIDLECNPHAESFIRAISACSDTIAMHLTDKGQLAIRSGKFKTFVPCDTSNNFPDIAPTGRFVALTAKLLPALTYLMPFISEDASRQWSRGMLFEGGSAFATNNTVLVQYWLGYNFPDRVNIPGEAIKQLLEFGMEPVRMQIEEGRKVTFHFDDGRWLSTQLYEATWPDAVTMLDKPCAEPQMPFPDDFWEALDQIEPFCDESGRCYLLPDRIATMAEPDLAGTAVSVPGLPGGGLFNARRLSALRDIADTIAFSAYPAPVPFYGKASRGIIAGIFR